ncbi:hypothetical protein [Paenibacillus sp. 481]|uniref:hypothetical protein n=1 Tax=Paenibacillus sp. 481 TaxID=2835869 RepID=UPI001E4C73B5|nr:hypothetical protein [Paenibacillus sp. 481]UHA72711.1 hypothetical protein KIK04_19040 [Paenibacillus sp. 481]
MSKMRTGPLLPIVFIMIAIMLSGAAYFLLRQEIVNETVIMSSNIGMIVLIPTTFYLLWARPKSLPREYVYVWFIFSVALTYFITPLEHRYFLQGVLKWLLPVVEILLVPYIIYRIYTIVKRYRAVGNREELDPISTMKEALMPIMGDGVVLNILLTEMSVFFYSLFAWFKKNNEPKPGTYTYHKDSQIKVIVIVFIILIIVESVALHFLLVRWSIVLAWITAVLNVYGILYMIALYNSFRLRPHRLTNGQLKVNLGFQGSITVEVDNIEAVNQAKPFELGEKIPDDIFVSFMRLDAPQLEICLKEPVQMQGSYGIKKMISKVVMRADNVNDFTAELEQMRDRYADTEAYSNIQREQESSPSVIQSQSY